MTNPQKKIRLVGVPLDLGGGRRGVDMGPSALRIAGLSPRLQRLGYEVDDEGNIDVPELETKTPGNPQTKYLTEIAAACRKLYKIVRISVRDGYVPLVLGGDHSLAVGSIGAVADEMAQQGRQLGVLWIDAHGDMNTPETTETGNVHGMPLAAIIGLGADALVRIGDRVPMVPPDHVALVGVRSLDAGERRQVRASGLRVYTMRQIDEQGIASVLKDILTKFTDVTDLHVSFDMDSLDPTLAPGIGTPAFGGLRYREAHLALEMIADTGLLRSMDMVEINPILDVRNQTAQMAVEFICSAFGQRIL
jgi:arginase